jgi:hypothetical protein
MNVTGSKSRSDRISDRMADISAHGAPAVVASLVFLYFISPLVAFADPGHLFIVGFSMASSVGLALAIALYGRRSKAGFDWMVTFGLMVAPVGAALIALGPTFDNARRNREQCRALQIDMSSVRPHRKDSREMFEALKCSPQAVGTVQFWSKPLRQ